MTAIQKGKVAKLIVILLSACCTLTAQTPQAKKSSAETYLLKEGTEVDLKFSEALSSKTATEDDRVNLELSEDLKVGERGRHAGPLSRLRRRRGALPLPRERARS